MSADPSYDRMRRDFEALDVQKQAQFLIEASASTLANGIERIGQVLADGVGDVARRANRSSSPSDRSSPRAAEPETAQRQAPKSGASAE